MSDWLRQHEIEEREIDRTRHFAKDDRDRAIIRLTDGKVTIHDVIDTTDRAETDTANTDSVAGTEQRDTE